MKQLSEAPDLKRSEVSSNVYLCAMKYFNHSPECVFYFCCGSKCKKRGGKHLYKTLKGEIKHRHLKRDVQVIKTGCTDRCKMGPVLAIMPQNEWHLEVKEEQAMSIFNSMAARFARR